MDYFYADPEEIHDDLVRITGEEVHHLSRVMRKSVGDEIYVSAGAGVMYRVRIEDMQRDAVTCRIAERMERYNELPQDVTLVQGILKNPGKMDFIIEKAVELGVAHIIPVQSRYTVAKGGKVGRWRSIALAAMKQCGRCRLPVVEEPGGIVQAFETLEGLRIVCYEQEDTAQSLETVIAEANATGPVAVIIGPEGGFSDEELAAFRDGGAVFASLGARRLRGETAAIAALARTAAVLEQPHNLPGRIHVV